MDSDLKKYLDSYENMGGVARASLYDRQYQELTSGRNVRSQFNKSDYEYYRNLERVPDDIEESIELCNKVYENTPFVRSIVDMMADFTVQGIRIEHPDPKLQNFLNEWGRKVDFQYVSERIANMLYRVGNAPIYIAYGKVGAKYKKEWAKADLELENQAVIYNRIPLKYQLLFPTMLVPNGSWTSNVKYGLKITNEMRMDPGSLKSLLESLNINIGENKNVLNGASALPLPEESVNVLFYKKDCWLRWARPLTHAILDSIFMLNKLRLCDKKAVDGLLSQVRLWNLGNFEHKVYPSPGAINKIKAILASVGSGDSMDVVWGPELSFTESNSNAYNFLKPEKYEHVMREIYAGLGVPPSLTGSDNNGSASDNSISMKTLVERLEYGRRILTTFWVEELNKISKAFNWKTKPIVTFDYKVLSDENLERKLLIDLWDRHIISDEKLRQLSRQDHRLEELRIKKQEKKRERGEIPKKASPYHNPNDAIEYKKILLNSGYYTPSQLDIELEENDGEVAPMDRNPNHKQTSTMKKDVSGKGRPYGTKDSHQRQRNDNNTTKGFIDTMNWATKAQYYVHELLLPLCEQKFEKMVADFSLEEKNAIECIKTNILSNLKPHQELSQDILQFSESSVPEYMDLLSKCLDHIDTMEDLIQAKAFIYAQINCPSVIS